MYSYEKINDEFETYLLANANKDTFIRVVPERGGILTEFVVNGKPIFYLDRSTLMDRDKNIRGGNPILFPICGSLTNETYSLNGHSYNMKQHGFARNRAWNVVDVITEENSASIKLELGYNDDTLAQYPFKFKLIVEYILNGSTLSVNAVYLNQDDKPMPFYAGYHPYFHAENKESLVMEIPSQTYKETVTGSIVNQQLNYNQDEINVSYQGLAESHFHLKDPERNLNVKVRFDPIFKHIVVWTLKGKDFLCIEPWMARTDALNTKEDLVIIPPGQEFRSNVTFEVEKA